MAKPLVIAKQAGPNWTIHYIDTDIDEARSITVIGSPNIEDALREAMRSLDAQHVLYTITQIVLDRDNASQL